MAAPNEQASQPTLCAAGCGFFGNPATLNMCSKCFRAHKATHPDAPPPASAPPASAAVANATSAPMETCVPADVGDDMASVSSASEPKKTKCALCKKKVGLHGFKCKCEGLFCAAHRYAVAHACTYDYRAEAREALEKANPTIRGEKVSRF